ncbi:MAG: hypothetical protein GF308_09050 [Candidatus Heimdallarchaeota archaeon]|nr:hypothetical protein [Candidatus Heimdallarchaeota archaeon]
MNKKDSMKDAYKAFADELDEIEEEDEKKRKETLRKGILKIEQDYKDEIKGTHAVDARLVKLRQEADMSELIGTGEKVQKSRFKDKDKFYQFLAKEILEVGIKESKPYGGILTFADFCRLFADQRPHWEVRSSDIRKALEELAIAGLIPKLYRLKNDSFLITFKPMELQPDILKILYLVSGTGQITDSEVQTLLGWEKERVELTMYALVEQELAIYDDKEDVYYFPAFE